MSVRKQAARRLQINVAICVLADSIPARRGRPRASLRRALQERLLGDGALSERAIARKHGVHRNTLARAARKIQTGLQQARRELGAAA